MGREMFLVGGGTSIHDEITSACENFGREINVVHKNGIEGLDPLCLGLGSRARTWQWSSTTWPSSSTKSLPKCLTTPCSGPPTSTATPRASSATPSWASWWPGPLGQPSSASAPTPQSHRTPGKLHLEIDKDRQTLFCLIALILSFKPLFKSCNSFMKISQIPGLTKHRQMLFGILWSVLF